MAINVNNTITYTPGATFSGVDTFSYSISDAAGLGDAATVSVTVAPAPPVNRNPTAAADSAVTNFNTAVTIDVLANDTDPDSDALGDQRREQRRQRDGGGGGRRRALHPVGEFQRRRVVQLRGRRWPRRLGDGRRYGHGESGAASAGLADADGAGLGERKRSADDSAGSSTSGPTVLVAFAGTRRPDHGREQPELAITRAGLTWTRVARAATSRGVSEIWTANAPASLSGAQVTSAQSVTLVLGLPVNQMVTVAAFSNATGVGATNIRSAASGAPSISLVTTSANSLIYGVGNDFDQAIARTVGAGQVKVDEFLAPSGDTMWVQARTTLSGAAGSTVTLNDTAPTGNQWNFAIVEIK